MSFLTQIRIISRNIRGPLRDVRFGCNSLSKDGVKSLVACSSEPHHVNSQYHAEYKIYTSILPRQDTPSAYQNERQTLSSLVTRQTINQLTMILNNFTSSNHYHDSGRESFNSYRTKKSHSMRYSKALFGLLGLFGGMTAQEVESEIDKLSDEQKAKKMSPLELQVAKGVLAMCNQEYVRANEHFHQALHLAQQDENEDQETLVLNLLAANYFEKGDFEKAEKLFIDLMRRLIAKEVSPTDPAILELSLKLASIYSRSYSTHAKALKGFKFVINSLLTNLDDVFGNLDGLDLAELDDDKRNELALLGWSYDWFAKHLIAVNDFRSAAEMLQKALDISMKVLGPLHDQTLILLNDLGTTLAMNDATERGKVFLKKAVEGAIKTKSQELASFYVNLGLVNIKLRSLDEAKRYCEYSIELAMKNYDHPSSKEVLKISKNCLSEIERLRESES